MASTFSTRLKIELIGDGEQAGSWGTTTNNNLNQSLEQSIAGVLTVATTGTGTTTLSRPEEDPLLLDIASRGSSSTQDLEPRETTKDR